MVTEFGKILKSIRLRNGQKQKDMAKLLHVSDSYLSHLENGRKNPTPEFLERLFNHYDVDEENIYNIESLVGKKDDYLIVNIAGLRRESKGLFLSFIANFNDLTDNQKKGIENIVLESRKK